MATQALRPPTDQEVTRAFYAGFHSIDEGYTFWDGFNEYLMNLGYLYQANASCICSDHGEHGHLPECRWVKRAS
jgi:hypothetical protein